MPDQPTIAIFAGNKAVKGYLADIAARAGYVCVFPECVTAGADFILAADHPEIAAISGDAGQTIIYVGERLPATGVRVLSKPLRAAALIETLQRNIEQKQQIIKSFAIAGHIVDTREGLWFRKNEAPVRLTEKEVALLYYLKEAAPAAVPRQALLDKIWAYAEGVETHTIETHIYRLRQKIENDPSMPQILVTTEEGYALAE